MEIEIDYLERILKKFITANSANLRHSEFIEDGFFALDDEEQVEKACTHMRQLVDLKCIQTDCDGGGFSNMYGGNVVADLHAIFRITATGRDFYTGLQNKTIRGKAITALKEYGAVATLEVIKIALQVGATQIFKKP